MKDPEETLWRTQLAHLSGKPGVQGAEVGDLQGRIRRADSEKHL